MLNWKKHEYAVECKCGHKQTNNDDGVCEDVVLVKISYCRQCCPRCAGRPIQIFYDKNNNRIS